jgi:hypothetical protein
VPWYEKPEDLVAEHRTMCAYMIWLQQNGIYLWSKKIPVNRNGQSVPDFRLMNNGNKRPIGYTEIKNRKESCQDITDYGGLYLSENKYEMMKLLADNGFESKLIVGLKDLLGYYNIHTCTIIDRRMGGRTDRNDPNDVGPVVVFDPDELKEFFPSPCTPF